MVGLFHAQALARSVRCNLALYRRLLRRPCSACRRCRRSAARRGGGDTLCVGVGGWWHRDGGGLDGCLLLRGGGRAHGSCADHGVHVDNQRSCVCWKWRWESRHGPLVGHGGCGLVLAVPLGDVAHKTSGLDDCLSGSADDLCGYWGPEIAERHSAGLGQFLREAEAVLVDPA